MSKTERIVVIGADGKHYVGNIELNQNEEVPNLGTNEAICLKGVYQLITFDSPIMDQATGRVSGITRGHMFMDVGSANGALAELYIKAVGWYWPENCGLKENIDSMYAQAEEQARRSRDRKGSSPIARASASALSMLDAMGPSSIIKGKR